MTTAFRYGLVMALAAVLGLGGCRSAESAPEAAAPPTASPAVGGEAAKPKLTVYVPCGMIDAFRKLQAKYEASHPVDMDITFDNAVVLLKLIRSGQRPDVLVSPGRLEMQMMEDEKYVDPASTVTFGSFKMIVVVPKANKAGIQSWEDLAKPEVTSIGVADPTQNSVGYYAEESLKKLGIYDQVKPKIRHNWHAKTAVDWVCTGRVDAGLYFNSCPFESGPEKLEGDSSTYHIVGELPEGSYPPIEVQAARLVEAPNAAAADEFLKYLMSSEGQEFLAAHGIPPYESAGGSSREQGAKSE